MYLSDRDLAWAIANGDLVFSDRESTPPPKIDPTSIDLHLDSVTEAKVWDISRITDDCRASGIKHPELRIGKFQYVDYATKYLRDLPEDQGEPVYRRGREVIIKPGGFVLWQTREIVGTQTSARI